jgi:hypothetical protein
MVFLKTKRRKWLPVNVVPTKSHLRGPNAGETKFIYNEHEPHFATCPCAGEFRKGAPMTGGWRAEDGE